MSSPAGTTSLSEGNRRVSEAVILMAGSGSRFRGADKNVLKPLAPVLGRPLIVYILSALLQARIKKVNIVVGYESERLSAAVSQLAPPEMALDFIYNPAWERQNGVSVLAVADSVAAPFLLAMSDHLFENAILARLISAADLNRLNLAVDKKLDSIFDLNDAMKIQTRGERIVAIGKTLATYDAIDTGLFVCPSGIFDYLEQARVKGDCSLADGVRLMARNGKARAIDIGDAWWQDVDTPEMLAHASEVISNGPRRHLLAGGTESPRKIRKQGAGSTTRPRPSPKGRSQKRLRRAW